MKKYLKAYLVLVLVYAVVLAVFHVSGAEMPKVIKSVYSLLQLLVVVCALSGPKRKNTTTAKKSV